MSCWFYSTFSLHLCDVKRLFSSLMADTYTHLRQSISITGELHRPCFCEEKRFYLAGTKKLVCIPIREGVRRRKTFFPLQNMTKCYGTPSKKKRDYLGIFPKCRPPPPFGNPCFQKKKYGLFCILGPLEHFWSSSKCSLFGNYSDIYFWE